MDATTLELIATTKADRDRWKRNAEEARGDIERQLKLRLSADAEIERLTAEIERLTTALADRCPACGLGPMAREGDARYCIACIHEAAAAAEADGLNEWMAAAKESEAEVERLTVILNDVRYRRVPGVVTIHTPTGEIVQRIDGVILSDTTHPPPSDTTIHSIPMPYMPGGVGVTVSVPGQVSVASERREMEKDPPHR